MTLQYQSSLLENTETAFRANNKRFGKLNDYIMELQGSGNTHINALVNNLIFLRRELMSDHPNELAVQRLLASLYQQTNRLSNTSYASVIEELRKSIVEAAR